MSIFRRTFTAVALTFAATAGMANAAQPAQAAAPCSSVSCVWNYSASQVPTYCWSGCTPGVIGIGNGTRVGMACYWDADPWTGNYRSNRWFVIGVVPLAGQRLVHSSYVFNQTGVPRC